VTSAGFPGGRFAFNGAYTASQQHRPAQTIAHSRGPILVGLPTRTNGGNVATPGTVFESIRGRRRWRLPAVVHALFVQDDLARRPPIDGQSRNAAEIQSGPHRRSESQLAGFDLTTSTRSKRRRSRRCAHPSPKSRRRVRRSRRLRFADGFDLPDAREGSAARGPVVLLTDKTVVRAGVGRSPTIYSSTTSTSRDSPGDPDPRHAGQRPDVHGADLSNPIPGGRADSSARRRARAAARWADLTGSSPPAAATDQQQSGSRLTDERGTHALGADAAARSWRRLARRATYVAPRRTCRCSAPDGGHTYLSNALVARTANELSHANVPSLCGTAAGSPS